MRDLKIAEVHKIAFAAGQPLEGNEIGKRADQRLDAIHPTNLPPRRQLVEAERRGTLSEKV